MIPHSCPCGNVDSRTNLGAVFCLACFTKPLWERQQLLKDSEAVEGYEREAA